MNSKLDSVADLGRETSHLIGAAMASLPGRTCGACTLCCSVLEIEVFNKPPGKLCTNCEVGRGCTIYAERPEVCREYECLWLTEREVPTTLKPDRFGALLMEDPDSDQYLAVCAPSKPMAWRHPIMFKYLVAKAKEGRVVVAKAGLNAWRVFESGEWSPWV